MSYPKLCDRKFNDDQNTHKNDQNICFKIYSQIIVNVLPRLLILTSGIATTSSTKVRACAKKYSEYPLNIALCTRKNMYSTLDLRIENHLAIH